MAIVDELTNSFLAMSYSDKEALIHAIRQRRRTKPVSRKAFKKAAKGTRSAKAKIKGGTSKLTPDQLINTLSPEAKQALLKELGVI